ncbi:alpha/beta hydrolase-fold protein [Thalassoglobus polymorphus]|uniref:Esterase n=1 Tax=Thalassoglobus polymorphus TaxID=2527994 RepID=A0A517QT26_9PLAN|nr:alpha/beta hydrolase-fold protein [Thalassoglobus polymorphus]QDT34742.1 Putative esterase [Thalassoglobus polymorphus]
MWQSIEIGGKEAEAFLPENRTSDHAIIYLHAHGEERLSEKDEFTSLFERYGYPVICPRGKKGWWMDVVCEEFDPVITPMEYVRKDVVDWIEKELQISAPNLALLGISMGGQGALNISYRYALTFPIVAAISSAVDFHKAYGQGYPLDQMFPSAELARQQSAVLHIHPLNWPKFHFFACDPMDPTWFEGNEILASKLSSSGIMYECDLKTSHGGHNWRYFTAMAEKSMEFIDHAFKEMS